MDDCPAAPPGWAVVPRCRFTTPGHTTSDSDQEHPMSGAAWNEVDEVVWSRSNGSGAAHNGNGVTKAGSVSGRGGHGATRHGL